jgi:hypothetical protein
MRGKEGEEKVVVAVVGHCVLQRKTNKFLANKPTMQYPPVYW